jgi:hypothetical protein
MRFSGAAFIACFTSFSLMPNAFAALSNKRSNLRERRTNRELEDIMVDANPDFTGLLGMCQGDCDGDEDCQADLYCFQREQGNIVVPGCSGGEDDDTSSDYCIAFPMVEANPGFTAPFGRCQGHCLTDDDCKSDLSCFQRGRKEAVPGCDGGQEDSTPSNYCTNNLMSPTIPVDANPDFTGLLGMCQGDCDGDEDCQADLYCFQRAQGNIAVPGCSGGEDDDTSSDYCIAFPTVEANPGFTAPFGRCQGSCLTDDECKSDLSCFQRGSNENVPGCDGGQEDSTPSNYCTIKSSSDPIRAALAAFYVAADGDNWREDFPTNWGDIPLVPTCSLTAVSCSADGDITDLSLGK